MLGRKKIKKEIVQDDVSPVTDESQLDDLSVNSSELKGLTQLKREQLINEKFQIKKELQEKILLKKELKREMGKKENKNYITSEKKEKVEKNTKIEKIEQQIIEKQVIRSPSQSDIESQESQEQDIQKPIEKSDLECIRLSRDKVQKMIQHHEFQETVKNCFIKLAVPSQKKNSSYVIAEIKEVKDSDEPYKFMEKQINIIFICLYEKKERKIRFDLISNQPFGLDDWVLSMQKLKIPFPNLEFIKNKQQQINKIINYEYKPQEILKFIEDQMEKKIKEYDLENLPIGEYKLEIHYLQNKISGLELSQIELGIELPELQILKSILMKFKEKERQYKTWLEENKQNRVQIKKDDQIKKYEIEKFDHNQNKLQKYSYEKQFEQAQTQSDYQDYKKDFLQKLIGDLDEIENVIDSWETEDGHFL